MTKIFKLLTTTTLIISLLFPTPLLALEPATSPETVESNAEDTDADEEAAEAPVHPLFHAINPGYTKDGAQNFDDFVELYNPLGEPLSLQNIAIIYNDNFAKPLHSFADEDYFNAEFITLRYKSSPNANQADLVHATNTAVSSGRLTLIQTQGSSRTVLDDLCWGTDKDLLEKYPDCQNKYSHFNLAATRETALVRCLSDGLPEKCANGKDFENIAGYTPYFDSTRPAIIKIFDEDSAGKGETEDITDPALPKCADLRFSEIFTYYADAQSEQFIEFFNPTLESVDLAGCRISYKNRLYPLSGTVPETGYFAFRSESLKLTKNPTSSNELFLVDVTGKTVDAIEYFHGQKKSVSFAHFGIDETGAAIWRQTYAVTPDAENVFQEFRSCPIGKIINPATGNCINFVEQVALPDCGEGRYRHPETNRCRNIASASTGPASCQEGYERNPETNRCRKVRTNNGADYALEPLTFSEKSTFMAYGALSAVITTGVLYIVFQFRTEIAGFFKKLFRIKSTV